MQITTLIISKHHLPDNHFSLLEEQLSTLCQAIAGVEMLVVPHLYHLPQESPLWDDIRALSGAVVLFSWLHPRPAEWLLRRQGIAAEVVQAVNLADFLTADACMNAVDALRNPRMPDHPAPLRRIDAPVSERWYPVMDKARCTDCGHCRQFCLFGVYAQDDNGVIFVQEPDRCKPGCPACSRICPQGAIIFPLYEKDAAIAGAPGLYMAPDLAARKMYYLRTKTPCPVCGQTAQVTGPAPICPECGRSMPRPASPTTEDDDAFDDIDALIDAVDDLARRRS